MRTIGPPPELTERAAEQLRALGIDSALGFQQLRSIGRVTRANSDRQGALLTEKSNKEAKQKWAAPYTDKAAVGLQQQLRADLAAIDAELGRIEARLASLAREETENPLNFRTNCSDASRISNSVAGGSKLKRVLMLRHMVRKVFAMPNVRAEAGPTAKRQARAVENAPAHFAGLAF